MLNCNFSGVVLFHANTARIGLANVQSQARLDLMLFPLIARLGRMREEDITTNAACIWVSNRYGLRTLGHGNKLIRIELHGKFFDLILKACGDAAIA